MSVVASDLIRSSLRLLGVVATGETPGAAEVSDALGVLNDMLEAWALSDLMLYRVESVSVTLTPNKGVYTIGPGGDINVTRPLGINQAYVNYNGLDMMLRPPLTTDEWNRIALKSLRAPLPTALYYLAAHPLASLYVWPVPSLALVLALSANMQFAQIASPTQTISLPPGYQKALRYALAVELAPEYGLAPAPAVVESARSALAAIKVVNREMPIPRFDAALTGAGSSGIAGFLAGDY